MSGPACSHGGDAEYGAVTLYEHRAWSQFLLPACLPGAKRVTAQLGEMARDVLARLDPACKLFVFHIDLTQAARLPLDREDLIAQLRARGIGVCNARLTDISKRWLHDVCVRARIPSPQAPRDGDPDEQLMVKTNYNYHGMREAELTAAEREALGYKAPHDVPQWKDAQYRLTVRREVPEATWRSPHWVVERYIANAAHRFHRAYVARDAMVISAVVDPCTFKKMPEGIERESYYMTVSRVLRAPEVPDEIAEIGALCARVVALGFVDYAALDVVSDDYGGHYVIDLNTTPHWGDGGHSTLLSYLGAGLAGAYRAR